MYSDYWSISVSVPLWAKAFPEQVSSLIPYIHTVQYVQYCKYSAGVTELKILTVDALFRRCNLTKSCSICSSTYISTMSFKSEQTIFCLRYCAVTYTSSCVPMYCTYCKCIGIFLYIIYVCVTPSLYMCNFC
jgi:hypothetical protein